MRIPFVAGNWKMNTTKASAIALARGVAAGAPRGVEVGVAPPFVYLDAVGAALADSPVRLGAQNVCPDPEGAFTGEICVGMLKDLRVSFCLAGHSERRHLLHEPPELVAKKAQAIYSGGLTLIHCVGEKLEQRQGNQTLAVIRAQIDELSTSMTDPLRLVLAYEPVWAIGTGQNATAQQAQEVHAFIRGVLAEKWNKDFADRVRILYGGSMKPENAKELMSQPDVDGGLIGGAALKVESFLAIANAAKQ